MHHTGFLGERGYKALAFAISLNTTLEILNFNHIFEHEGEYNPSQLLQSDDDPSNGFIAKALKFNRDSELESLILCKEDFWGKALVAITNQTRAMAFSTHRLIACCSLGCLP
jgi:hypothetical protein